MVLVFIQGHLENSEEELARLQVQAQFLTRASDCGPVSVRINPPAPKVATNKRLLIIEATKCSACGMGFANDDMVGVCMLPCKHSFHLYCFGILCWLGDQCTEVGCNEYIPEAVKKSFFCSSITLPSSIFKTPKSKIHFT